MTFPILYYSYPVHLGVDTYIDSFRRSKHDIFDSHISLSTKERPEYGS
jgi:hypothetical protein